MATKVFQKKSCSWALFIKPNLDFNPTIFNVFVIHWVDRFINQVLFWLIGNKTSGCWHGFMALKTLYFYFCKFIKKYFKINWKDFCKEFCRNYEKIIILGTTDAWSMRPLSQQPSNLAYHIEDFLKYNEFGNIHKL